MLTVILGGARSGKSTAALRLAHRSGGEVAFIATSPRIAGDVDLDERIAAHQAERPATWATIEEEVELAPVVSAMPSDQIVVIDCLTVWLGNLMHRGMTDDGIATHTQALLTAVTDRTAVTIAVSNEVGLGIVPGDVMSRRYRDLLGRINQRWVAAADEAYLLVAGRALPLIELGASLR